MNYSNWLIDAIINEGPNQCAHNDFLATKENVTEYILTHLRELGKLDKDALIKQRQKNSCVMAFEQALRCALQQLLPSWPRQDVCVALAAV